MVSLVAWVILPAVLLATAFGLGALLALALRVSVPAALLAPLGAAAGIVLALTGYVVGLRGVWTSLVIVALAFAGLVLGVLRRGGVPRPGLGALVWSATYALYIAPVVLTGHWTWLGYNFVNDTSIQLILSEWLAEHGRHPAAHLFVSTPLDALSAYINSGYPLGSHALLAAMHELLNVRTEAIYQPFIATFAGLTALSLASLVRGIAGARWAALAAFTAVASNLLYQYALQGNMKEIVTATMLATTAAVAGWTLQAMSDADPAARGRLLAACAVLVAVPVAATVDVLSTAGAPYAALIVLAWMALLLARRLVPSVRGIGVALGVGAAALLACTAAQLSTLLTFGEVTKGTYAAPEVANDLGHLARPLEVRQTLGVWLQRDYRLPPIGSNATLTDVGVWIALALAVIALVYVLRRRRAEVLLFVLPVVLIMLVVTPRVSPYADAKTYMLMAPGVTLLAALGAVALSRAWAPLGVAAAAILVAGVLGSDALAYHGVQTAPIDRIDAMRDLDRRFAGQGPILFNEPEEFAKNFMGDTRLNVGAEAVTPAQTQLRVPQAFAYLWFDLDDQTLEYVERFPLIAYRRSPSASRPPANYRLVYENAYYEVWRKQSGPQVLEHMPLQALDTAGVQPSCQDVAALAARVMPGQALIAAQAPDVVELDTLHAARSPSWKPHPFRAGRVTTGGPGEAHGTVTFARSGRYRAWIAGTFGRAIEGRIDGRTIGAARGVNTVGQWHDIGTAEVSAGRHVLALRRGGGGLAPGDGYAGELGPLALERIEPLRLIRVPPQDAQRRLCGKPWDWIERVGP